jgi:uncharacterized protein (TIGR02145 family)
MKNVITLLILLIGLLGCNDDSSTSIQNQKPKVINLAAHPSQIEVNEETTLTCIATDADGDNLTVWWSSTFGTFPNGFAGLSVKWKAPYTKGKYVINANVSDGKETVVDSISVDVIKSFVCGDTISYAGKIYNTVKIGAQCWFKENLDVGIMIDHYTAADTQKNNNVIEKYCYDNLTTNCNYYGGLYQWDEAMQYSTLEGAQGICPDGWHIPTAAEFGVLLSTVNYDGNSLLSIGQGIGTGAGTNTSGFSALLAGAGSNGIFELLSAAGIFWSSTEIATIAKCLFIECHGVLDIFNSSKKSGFSIRCIKD